MKGSNERGRGRRNVIPAGGGWVVKRGGRGRGEEEVF